ncbi:mechanosensitive ion channel domain-containing protein [Frankia canadensis]
MRSTIAVLTVLAGAVLLALATSLVVHRVALRIGRHSGIVADLARRAARPLRLTLVLIALQIALGATPEQDWTASAARVCGILLIAGLAWCVTVLAFVFEEVALAHYRVDVADNRHARRVRTQVGLLRRITVVVIAVIAAASMLMTIPSVRVAGASIFASAGVVGIVAGLAAQTSLANVFSGLQIAFTDALRVDDVVVVEEEWGRIEEITLTYVVVHIWDDRRLILPSKYFTTEPFQNWTRRESAVLGAVELDLDWEIPLERMRAELHRVVESTDLWDGRTCVLQVTDAVGDHIRIRVLVSGKDGPTTFDLRCHVREALVVWVQRHHPAALPRTRIEFDAAAHLFAPAQQARPNGNGADDHPLRKREDGRQSWVPVSSVALSDRTGQHGRTAAPPAPAQRAAEDTAHTADATEDARLFSGASPDAAQRARAFSESVGDPDPDPDQEESSAEDQNGPRQS